MAKVFVGELVMSVWQDGMKVAEVSGADHERVRADAAHYALMYGQDGPLQIKERRRRDR